MRWNRNIPDGKKRWRSWNFRKCDREKNFGYQYFPRKPTSAEKNIGAYAQKLICKCRKQKKINICLSTDSLASNHDLSILKEMITLQQRFPGIALQELVGRACLNGARALQVDSRFGSFETGKKPGVNLITGVDLIHLKLTNRSKVKVMRFRK